MSGPAFARTASEGGSLLRPAFLSGAAHFYRSPCRINQASARQATFQRALNIHSGLASIIEAGHAKGWMMWAEQPGHDELEARRDRLVAQNRGGRDMNCAATRAVGELHPELPGWTEQLAIAIAASADAHDIRLDRSDRITVEAAGGRPRVRWGKLLIVSAASFCLMSASLLGAYRFLRRDSASSPPPVQSPSTPAGIANSGEGYRVTTKPTIVRAADRAAPASVPAGPNPAASTRTAHPKPARAVVPPATSASHHVTPAPPFAPSPPASAARLPTEAPLTPVPETRPTTIDGWVLREVVNGTAVLEGPDGIVRVKRGDTVQGVGRVVSIFGWGHRLIVATSRGLISTP